MTNSVEVGKAEVAFRVDGAGPGLMLLHGAGGNSETNWGPVVGRLSERHTVVRPDYSGSGETIDDGRPLTVPMLAAQAVAAAKQAGAIPFDLVGFSLGAVVATYIAAEYADLVRSVILLAGSAASVNNAPIAKVVGPRLESTDGFELHFAVNYFATFLLTRLLRPLLGARVPSRVLNVVSARQSPIDIENVMLSRSYDCCPTSTAFGFLWWPQRSPAGCRRY
jgi:pimeloyl-ACP methyl ester carboxylesterase